MRNDVAIIGGGISGLTCLHYLTKAGVEARLYEAESSPGGKIKTHETENWLDELGPIGFLSSRTDIVSLANEVGLSDHIIQADSAAAIRYIILNGKLNRVPESPPAFLTCNWISAKGKIRALRDFFHPRSKADDPDETIANFANRHFGREIYEKLIDPGVLGVFATPASELSLVGCVPALRKMEVEHGSILRGLIKAQKARKALGKTHQLSFTGGMKMLVEKLAADYSNKITYDRKVLEISRSEAGFRLRGDEWQTEVGQVIMANPAYSAAEICQSNFPQIAMATKEISFKDITVWICWTAEELNPAGFGYLVPTSENTPLRGCLWTSSIFPLQRQKKSGTLFRFILDGDMTDPSTLCLEHLGKALGKKITPTEDYRYFWPKAIPAYSPGHTEKLTAVRSKIPGLHLTGYSYDGVSLGECVTHAKLLAERIAKKTK